MSTIKLTCTDGRPGKLTIDGEPVPAAVRLWLEIVAHDLPVITIEELMLNGERTTGHFLESFTIEAASR
jgi:hypothetical protein